MSNQSRADRRRTQPPVEPPPEPVNLDVGLEEDEAQSQSKVELFTLDDRTYYMAEPDARLILKMLRTIRQNGEMVAVSMMLEELIGPEAYDALMSVEGLKNKELDTILRRVMHFATGRLEGVLGN